MESCTSTTCKEKLFADIKNFMCLSTNRSWTSSLKSCRMALDSMAPALNSFADFRITGRTSSCRYPVLVQSPLQSPEFPLQRSLQCAIFVPALWRIRLCYNLPATKLLKPMVATTPHLLVKMLRLPRPAPRRRSHTAMSSLPTLPCGGPQLKTISSPKSF